LQYDSLKQIVLDVNLKIGSDMHEKDGILNNLVESEIIEHENFVSENSETALPSSVEVEQLMVGTYTPVKGDMMSEIPVTPVASLKEPKSS
jgi:hypothetical protein